MKAYHRFNQTLLATVAIVSLVLIATSLYLDKPTNGDMTRVGGYSDNDFGWNKPLEMYSAALYQLNLQGYQGYADLVVLGDSFSSGNPRMNWVNYFVDGTGVSAQVLHFDQGGIERILSSEAFEQTPPKYLVVQSIEPALFRRFSDRSCELSEPEPVALKPLSSLETSGRYATEKHHRETEKTGLDLDQAGSFLGKAIPRWLGLNVTDAIRLGIDRSDLFSSRVKDQILVHEGDLAKRDLPADSSAIMHCNLLRLQLRAQANGYTRFVVMVVPDKLTAYSPVLRNKELSRLSIIAPLAARTPALNLIRLDQLMRQQVHAGTVDLYLPNDTHWTSTGYRLAAEEMVDYLNQLGAAVGESMP